MLLERAMKLPRRKLLRLAAGAAVLPVAARVARAEIYPARGRSRVGKTARRAGATRYTPARFCRANSGLPEFASLKCRKSGKPDLQCVTGAEPTVRSARVTRGQTRATPCLTSRPRR